MFFHQDNATAPKSVVAMAEMHECSFEFIDNPSHSPNLAPSDIHCFLNLKKKLPGKYFANDDDAISSVEEEALYTSGIQALQHRW